MGNLSKQARWVVSDVNMALQKIVPLSLVSLNADGWNVLKGQRNSSMRQMALDLLKYSDGLLLQEAHVYYHDYSEVEEWAHSHSLVLFVDFDPSAPAPTSENHKSNCALFHKSAVETFHLRAGNFVPGLFHEILGKWGAADTFNVLNHRCSAKGHSEGRQLRLQQIATISRRMSKASAIVITGDPNWVKHDEDRFHFDELDGVKAGTANTDEADLFQTIVLDKYEMDQIDADSQVFTHVNKSGRFCSKNGRWWSTTAPLYSVQVLYDVALQKGLDHLPTLLVLGRPPPEEQDQNASLHAFPKFITIENRFPVALIQSIRRRIFVETGDEFLTRPAVKRLREEIKAGRNQLPPEWSLPGHPCVISNRFMAH